MSLKGGQFLRWRRQLVIILSAATRTSVLAYHAWVCIWLATHAEAVHVRDDRCSSTGIPCTLGDIKVASFASILWLEPAADTLARSLSKA